MTGSGSGTTAGRSRWEPDKRRDQILACARELFGDQHYETVSNADIARAAGISRGLLNHYFGSKRELYLEIVRSMLDVPPIPVPEYVEGAAIEERVSESIDGWLELLARNPETWLASIEIGGLGTDAELDKIVDDARQRAVDRIIAVTGLRFAVRENPEIRGILRGFSGMAEATTCEWLRHGRLTRDQVHAMLEGALLNIIRTLIPRVVAATGQDRR